MGHFIWEFVIGFFFFSLWLFCCLESTWFIKPVLNCIRYQSKGLPVITPSFPFQVIFFLCSHPCYPPRVFLDHGVCKIKSKLRNRVTSFSRFDSLDVQSHHTWPPDLQSWEVHLNPVVLSGFLLCSAHWCQQHQLGVLLISDLIFLITLPVPLLLHKYFIFGANTNEIMFYILA